MISISKLDMSVVVAARIRCEKLRATIASITDKDFAGTSELIVVDNSSSDDMAAARNHFNRRETLQSNIDISPSLGRGVRVTLISGGRLPNYRIRR